MSELTRDQVKARINALIVDNETWQITPQNVRDVLTDIADSFTQPHDDTKEITVLSANISSAAGLSVEGIKVVGTQQPVITDVNNAQALADFTTAINSILAAMRTHGLIATVNP